jgi:hypothetical protein
MTTTTNTQNTSNSAGNKAFLDYLGWDYKNVILTNIANHYGITNDEAYDEVTHDEAEHIFEYVTGVSSRITVTTLYNDYLLNKNN